MRLFDLGRCLGRLGTVTACLAVSIPGCSQSAATSKTLGPSDLGLSVTQRARLREPAEPAYASIASMAFSRDGKELAITRVQAALRSQQTSSAHPSLEYTSILETFRVRDFTRTGIITSAGCDKRFHVLVAPHTKAGGSDDVDPFMVVRGAFYCPKEITVASGKNDVIRSLRFEPRLTFTHEPSFPPNGVAVAPNSQRVAVALGGDHDQDLKTPCHGEVILWNFATGEQQLRFHSTDVAFFAVAFSPDGRLFAAAGGTYVGNRNGKEVYRGELRCWDLTTGKLLFKTESPTSLRCIAFSPDGRTIAAGGIWGTVRFYRATDGGEYASHQFVPLAATARSEQAPDGRQDDSRDSAPVTGSPLILLDAVAFSPDGTFLAAGVGSYNRGASWGEVRMLDIANKRSATVGFQRHAHPVTCVAFSPNGNWLAAGTPDGFLRVFSVKPLTPVSDRAGKQPARSSRD